MASRILACAALWLASFTGAAAPAAGAPPLAQSSQLIVNATVTDEWLTLHILRASDQSPVVTKDVGVSVAGHAIPVSAHGDGSYVLPVKQLGKTTEPVLDVTVGHDGIREVLSGKLSIPAAAPESEGGHNQMLWWVINVGIVFVAALVLSNRKKKTAE